MQENNPFYFENNFFYTCGISRLKKFIFLYDAMISIKNIDGDIIECGVFKGVSLIKIASIRDILKINKKIIAFDVFDKFPQTDRTDEKLQRDKFVTEAGEYSIDIQELYDILQKKNLSNIELIKGDVLETLRDTEISYISLINLDLDLYEPTMYALKVLWNKLSKGGIIILDNYNKFYGDTNAVNEFFSDKDVRILKYLDGYLIRK